MYLCVSKKGGEKMKEKGGNRPHSPLRGPRLPCHRVSTPALRESGQGRDAPVGPSLACASPVSGFVLWMPASSSRVALGAPTPVALRGEISWKCQNERSLVPLSETSLRTESQPPASHRLPSFPEGYTSGLPRGYPHSPLAPSSVGVIPPGRQSRNLR